jgi:hypothetical protein
MLGDPSHIYQHPVSRLCEIQWNLFGFVAVRLTPGSLPRSLHSLDLSHNKNCSNWRLTGTYSIAGAWLVAQPHLTYWTRSVVFLSDFTAMTRLPIGDNIRLVKFSLHLVWFIEKDLKISRELLWTSSLWVLAVLVHPVLQCILYVVGCIALVELLLAEVGLRAQNTIRNFTEPGGLIWWAGWSEVQIYDFACQIYALRGLNQEFGWTSTCSGAAAKTFISITSGYPWPPDTVTHPHSGNR